MRTKKVNRYWCDHCNKAGLQAGAMRKHEKHCTMNPARSCRVCVLIEDGLDSDTYEAKKPLADLIAMLPDSTRYHASEYDWENCIDPHRDLMLEVEAVLPALRVAAGNCPACMLAALRLRKIPVDMAEGFDFKTEMQAVFADREPEHGRDY